MTLTPAVAVEPAAPGRDRLRGRGRVLLSPIRSVHAEEPVGYLTHLPADEPTQELATIRWVLDALDALAPDAFLLTFPSTAAMALPDAEEILGHGLGRRFLPALEAVRMGRRKTETRRAVENLRRLGLPVAVWGPRLSSPGDFDALVVDRARAASFLAPGDRTLIVTGVESVEDSRWAVDQGATLAEGPAVGAPIKVAPVDLDRLRR